MSNISPIGYKAIFRGNEPTLKSPVTNSVQNKPTKQEDTSNVSKKGMSTTGKTIIGLAGLAAVGGLVYFATRGKSNKNEAEKLVNYTLDKLKELGAKVKGGKMVLKDGTNFTGNVSMEIGEDAEKINYTTVYKDGKIQKSLVDGEIAETYKFNDKGKIEEINYPEANVTRKFRYDEKGKLANMEAVGEGLDDENVENKFINYKYDKNGKALKESGAVYKNGRKMISTDKIVITKPNSDEVEYYVSKDGDTIFSANKEKIVSYNKNVRVGWSENGEKIDGLIVKNNPNITTKFYYDEVKKAKFSKSIIKDKSLLINHSNDQIVYNTPDGSFEAILDKEGKLTFKDFPKATDEDKNNLQNMYEQLKTDKEYGIAEAKKQVEFINKYADITGDKKFDIPVETMDQVKNGNLEVFNCFD